MLPCRCFSFTCFLFDFSIVKKTKVAFVDVAAKPPRGVKRQQLKHGTAGPMGAQDSLSRLTSHGGSAKAPRAPAPSSSHSDVSERFKKGAEKFILLNIWNIGEISELLPVGWMLSVFTLSVASIFCFD